MRPSLSNDLILNVLILYNTSYQNQNDYRVCFPLLFAIKFCSEGRAELGCTLQFLQTCQLTLCLGIWKEKCDLRDTASIRVKTQVTPVTGK